MKNAKRKTKKERKILRSRYQLSMQYWKRCLQRMKVVLSVPLHAITSRNSGGQIDAYRNGILRHCIYVGHQRLVNSFVSRRHCTKAAVARSGAQRDYQGPRTSAIVSSRLRTPSVTRNDSLSCVQLEQQHKTHWMSSTTSQAWQSGETIISIRCKYLFVFATPRRIRWTTVSSGLSNFNGVRNSILASIL